MRISGNSDLFEVELTDILFTFWSLEKLWTSIELNR
jgi:hypothetical protein